MNKSSNMNKSSKMPLLFLFFLALGPIQLKSKIITLENKQYFVESETPGATVNTKYLYEIEHKLYTGKSNFQDIEVLKTAGYGNMLALDGIVQTTEKDEFIYHENISHLPMFYHANPQKVLIIGGGDGGTLRELLKHPVQEVHMVEIDPKVIEVSKIYLPSISNGAFENEKANIVIGDGKEFIKTHKNYFDIIILDLSDPSGPAEELISESFYTDVKDALKKDGIVSIQSESLTVQSELAVTINQRLKNVFASVKVHQIVVPTYEGGVFSITVASNDDLDQITYEMVEQKYNELNLNLKYYHPEIHFSSTILPLYLEKLFTS